jgi:hypothetical protein
VCPATLKTYHLSEIQMEGSPVSAESESGSLTLAQGAGEGLSHLGAPLTGAYSRPCASHTLGMGQGPQRVS